MFSWDKEGKKISLNPCFDGWWYRSFKTNSLKNQKYGKVLILVLMDGGIGEKEPTIGGQAMMGS